MAAPEWNFSGIAEFEIPLFGWGSLIPHWDVNFRSKPALLDFFNDRLADVLGRDPRDPDRRFDDAGCHAYYHDLLPSPAFAAGDGNAADEAGDIVTQLNGKQMTSSSQLRNIVAASYARKLPEEITRRSRR